MKFTKPFYTLTLLLLCCSMAYSQNAGQVRKLKNELGKITGSKEFKTATIGFCVMDVETGKVLVETNSEKSLIPASTMKLITTGAGLALLGDTFRFKTIVEFSPEGHFKKNTIVFRGLGDPTFGSTRLDSTNAIIPGICNSFNKYKNLNVFFDNRVFKDNNIPPGYDFGDLAYYYGVPVFPFNYQDNTQYLKPQTFQLPELYDPNILKDTTIYLLSGNNSFVQDSELNKKNYQDEQGFAEHSPEKMFLNDLLKYDTTHTNIFDKKNIQADGFYVHHISLRNYIKTFYSPQLLDIATKTNQSSINLYAEGILRAISTNKYGYSTLDSSISITRKFWKDEVGSLQGLRMTDGSGLSRSNLCTPLLFCKMLTAYTKRDNFNSFYSTIPIAGREGTVKNFAVGTAAENNARLKSGSMSRVKCYAGYVKGKNGKLYAVSIMFNNFEPDATVTAACAKLIGKVAELKGGKPKKEFVVNRGR